MPSPLIETVALSKQYEENRIKACRTITFSAFSGEIVAIAGENGAGKSTLMNLLAGKLPPSSGKILFEGNQLEPGSVETARRAGIFLVPQYPERTPGLTITELLLTGSSLIQGKIYLNYRKYKEQLREKAKNYSLDFLLNKKMEDLTAGQRYQAEMLFCLLHTPRVLILDEPTSILDEDRLQGFFTLLARLKQEGMLIFFITHRIEEILRYTDRILVLRKGIQVALMDTPKTNATNLSQVIAGKPEATTRGFSQQQPLPAEAPGLVLKNLSVTEGTGRYLRQINLEIPRGRITGIAGIRENGLDTLEEVLAGLIEPDDGEIEFTSEGNPQGRHPGRKKTAYIPTDRMGRGASLHSSLGENLILMSYTDLHKAGVLLRGRIRDFIRRLIDWFGIKGHPDRPLRELSGGNIQKTILTRELHTGPELVVISEPGWGLDEQSRKELYHRLKEQRDLGKAIAVLSTDRNELVHLSDRLYVLFDHRIEGPLKEEHHNSAELGKRILGIQS